MVEEITADDVRRFQTALQLWPRNARKLPSYRDLDAPQIIRKVMEQQSPGEAVSLLSGRTLGKHRDRVASFFNALVAAGVRDRSPLDGIKCPKSNPTDGSDNSRRAFTIEESVEPSI